jgi:hypothetical protein
VQTGSIRESRKKESNQVPTMTTSSRRKTSYSRYSASAVSGSSKKKTTDKSPAKVPLTTKGFQRHFAKHNYHDYAHLKPNQLKLLNVKPIRGGVHSPFPVILHQMMEDAEEKHFANVISWQPHGRSFLIRNPKDFVASVLPKYFKHSKLSSFQRQLSLYGFIRLTHDGPDRGAYYHESFLRGRQFLCANIHRTRIKGTWIRTSSSPSEEPNFYAMQPICDLEDFNGLPITSSQSSRPVDSDDESSGQSSDTSSDTPLQAPPGFPSLVMGPEQVTSSLKPKVTEYASSTRHPLLHLGFPALEDNELASFLTDIDLDTEFFSDIMQVSTV